MTQMLGRPGSNDTLLLCLDALSVTPDSDDRDEPPSGAWSANAVQLLEHARSEGWSVGHAISRRPRPGEAPWRPVRGVAPTPSEPVYHREQPSAFSSPELREALTRSSRVEVVVCGVSIQGSCLATALDALRLGLRLTVAMDAVWLTDAERTGLDGFLRLQRLGLTESVLRLAPSETIARPWQRLRLLQGGRA